MSTMKPMLAKDPNYDDKGHPIVSSYPVAVQHKLDGIRACVVDGKLVSRTLKPIPNQSIQKALARPEFEGFDGELIVGRPDAEGCMQRTSSFVMAPNKTGESWTYYVFDLWFHEGTFIERFAELEARVASLELLTSILQIKVVPVVSFLAADADQLEVIEAKALAEGHEGVIVRDPNALYKFGRSGKKGPLLKIKRFIDFEATITGVYEEMENTNEKVTNLLGRSERSTRKEGMVGKGRLGGFELTAINGPCEDIAFRCGTGFKAHERQEWWAAAQEGYYDGATVKIKSFPVGVKEAPRFPVFLGFRDLEIDG